MKKYYLFFTIVFLASCQPYQQQRIPLPPDTEYPSATPSAIPTDTPIPSPTIDYQSTAIIAQQTADEARRVNAVITADFEKRLQEQIMITAEHEKNVMHVYSWTADAAQTVIPLTATQQAALNTQIPIKQTMVSNQLTITAIAPTQLVAMADAERYLMYKEKYGGIDLFIRLFSFLATGIFAICLSIYLLRQPVPNVIIKDIPLDSVTETVLQLKTNNGLRSNRIVIPCSPPQLTELAKQLIERKKTLGINQWEGRDTLWTRDIFIPFRSWLRNANEHGGIKFVTPTDDNQLAPTDDLFDFLRGWLISQKIPEGYEFEENLKTLENESVARDWNYHSLPVTGRDIAQN